MTTEQREAARKLAASLSEGTCSLCNSIVMCNRCLLVSALLDAEAEVAAMKASLVEAGHGKDCASVKTCRCLPGKECDYCAEFVPGPCNCYLSTLSDSTARGQELLEKEAKLELASEFELDSNITVCRCRQRGGSIMWAVRRAGFCLAKDGEWEWEPLPSSRDEEFLSRCRFSSYEEAVSSLAKLKGESNA